MEYETLFVATKWAVLKEIAKQPLSPMQLAERLDTSIANISSQLRLLEAAQLVEKERTGKAKAGKPRSLFSLSRDFAHVSAATRDGLTFKELISLQHHQKTTIAVWSMPKHYQQPLLTFLFTHPELFSQDVYATTKDTTITLTTDSKGAKRTEQVAIGDKMYTITTTSGPTNGTQICFGGNGQ